MNNKKNRKVAVVASSVLLSVVGITSLVACDSVHWTPAYIVGETYCPYNPYSICMVMSDGDIVGPIAPSMLSTIVTGMIISSRQGSYSFVRDGSPVTTYNRITTISSSTAYTNRPPVSMKSELTQEEAGDTYNNGGEKYPKSPAAVKKVAIARASAAASRAAAKQSQAARYASQAAEPQDSVPAGYKPKLGVKPPVNSYKPPAPAYKPPSVSKRY